MAWLMKLFGEESAVGRFLNKLYVIVTSNLLFVLFSLPVITIGASLSALNYTMLKYRRGDRHFKVAAVFWKGFRECFVKATVCFVGFVALMLFQLVEISWCKQFAGPISAFQYALMGLMALEVILAVYLFPVIAAFHGGIGELLKNALFFAFSKPHCMLVCVALYVAPLALSYWFFQYLPLWAFLWLLLGFGLIVYLASGIMLRQFEPFLPEVDVCGDIIPPGMENDPNIIVSDGDDSDDAPDEKTLREMMKYGL